MNKRPEVFAYLDYRIFLKEWLAHRKVSQPGFSARDLAKRAEISPAYLSMVLSGKRPLTADALLKLEPHLGLSRSERSFIELLRRMAEADSQSVRLEALARLQRYPAFRKLNPREADAYRYLTRWYYVAIREMAAIPGFQADPEWIAPRLRPQVSTREITDAIEFLVGGGYITKRDDGSWRAAEKDIACMGGVFRVVMGQFHRDIFSLASTSIERIPQDRRFLLGHTFSVSSARLPEAKAILEDALGRVAALESAAHAPDSVYQLQLALFPMAETVGRPPERGTAIRVSTRHKRKPEGSQS